MRAIKSDSEAPASIFVSQFTLTLLAVKPAYAAYCDSFGGNFSQTVMFVQWNYQNNYASFRQQQQ